MIFLHQKAFTLIELIIVIVIIGILSTVTLKLDRWQIKNMEAMNDKEQRLARHRKENTLLTNTNYIHNTKITTGVIFTYTNGSKTIWLQSITPLPSYTLKNYTISGDLTITKQPLELWCSTSDGQTKLYLIGPKGPEKPSCFNLNTTLCSRESCQ